MKPLGSILQNERKICNDLNSPFFFEAALVGAISTKNKGP